MKVFNVYLSENQYKTQNQIAIFTLGSMIEDWRIRIVSIARSKEHGRGFRTSYHDHTSASIFNRTAERKYDNLNLGLILISRKAFVSAGFAYTNKEARGSTWSMSYELSCRGTATRLMAYGGAGFFLMIFEYFECLGTLPGGLGHILSPRLRFLWFWRISRAKGVVLFEVIFGTFCIHFLLFFWVFDFLMFRFWFLEFWKFEILKSWKVEDGHRRMMKIPVKKSSKSWIWISHLSKNMKLKFGNLCIFK